MIPIKDPAIEVPHIDIAFWEEQYMIDEHNLTDWSTNSANLMDQRQLIGDLMIQRHMQAHLNCSNYASPMIYC